MTDTLVVLDFPGRRAEAHLSDLRLEDLGWDVLYAISEPFSRSVEPSRYVAHLAGRCSGVPVRAVLAYCMAAPLARELAERLGGAGGPVPVVFFDGEPGAGAEIRETVGAVVRQLTGGPAEQLGGELAAAFADAELRERPERAMAVLAEQVVRLGAEVFQEDGFDEDEAVAAATRVSGFYLDWIAFLVASFRAGSPSSGAGSVTHIRSADHPVSDDWIRAGSLDVHIVDCVRAGLLADPRTRELTAHLLGSPAPARLDR